MAAVKRALISLSDKTGVVDFARSLTDLVLKSFPPAALPNCWPMRAWP